VPKQRGDGTWVSDDEQSFWDGQTWRPVNEASGAVVPAMTPPPSYPPQTGPSYRWIFWVLGAGCLVLVVVFGACVALGGAALFNGAQTLGGCPPGDLPIPPNAHVTGSTIYSGTSGTICTLGYADSDSGDQVDAFYRDQSSSWTQTGYDSSTDTFTFTKGRRTATVQVLRVGTTSELNIKVHN
jgi:hypothetical protein